MENIRIPVWLLSICIFVFIGVILERLYVSRVDVDIWGLKLNQKQTNQENSDSPISFMIKGGNNGTVSCDEFCSNKKWHGKSGTCVSAKYVSGPSTNDYTSCGNTPGLNNHLVCSCSTIK